VSARAEEGAGRAVRSCAGPCTPLQPSVQQEGPPS